jgi:hypothetical protein
LHRCHLLATETSFSGTSRNILLVQCILEPFSDNRSASHAAATASLAYHTDWQSGAGNGVGTRMHKIAAWDQRITSLKVWRSISWMSSQCSRCADIVTTAISNKAPVEHRGSTSADVERCSTSMFNFAKSCWPRRLAAQDCADTSRCRCCLQVAEAGPGAQLESHLVRQSVLNARHGNRITNHATRHCVRVRAGGRSGMLATLRTAGRARRVGRWQLLH